MKDLEYLRRKISTFSDDDLLSMVYVSPDDFLPEAITIAKEELKRRHIGTNGIEETEVQALSQKKKSEISIEWFNFYVYCHLRVGIILGVVSLFLSLLLPIPLITVVFTVLYLGFMYGVYIGLHKRRLWGWQLNWFKLFFEAFSAPLLGSHPTQEPATYAFIVAIVCLIWVLPNYKYFKKRHHLFQ